MVHIGDDTWHSLFPGYFEPNFTHSYDSFNVWDLHTVDNGVNEHLIPLLRTPEKWDVIFGHYLGVDHAGHRYGPDHAAMAAKLKQMDGAIREMIQALDDNTLLVVMGDHGMDAKGDHGGESDDEVEAALWMYSKKGVFGRSSTDFIIPPKTAKDRPAAQIDLVPTLSLLLGMPVPFNNLGTPIEEAFIGKSGNDWKNMAAVQALTASQIKNYQTEYAKVRNLDDKSTSEPMRLWNKALQTWTSSTPFTTSKNEFYRTAAKAFMMYQEENLRVCKSLWARFNVTSMVTGISILALGLVSLLAVTTFRIDLASQAPLLLQRIGIGTVAGAVSGAAVGVLAPDASTLNSVLVAISIGSLFGFASNSALLVSLSAGLAPTSLWGWMAVIFTVSQSIGFASNSYTIWEDEILLCFISTFALLSFVSSLRQAATVDRVLGAYHSILFLVITRVASLSRLCREEQMPYCRSTYYASATSSTSATWQLVIPFALALLIPSIIKSFYEGTRSYEASAIFWIGFAFRLGLYGSAVYWTLDAADNNDWLLLSSSTLGTIKVLLAQIILAIAFAAGTATYTFAPPCIRVSTSSVSANSPSQRPAVTILGFMNVHGSRYALLVTIWLLAIILVQKPMGGGAMGLLGWQIFSLAEILDTNALSESSAGPVVLALLGAFYFFKTGHTATLASIQWDSAFVAIRSASSTTSYVVSAVLVTLNMFGPQILAVIAVPLLVLWKQPPRRQGLLGKIVRAMACHVAYHAVINLATTMWAGHLRRHLMLYRIFSPRFMMGALVLLVVDLVGIVVALGGLRSNFLSVAEIFGW